MSDASTTHPARAPVRNDHARDRLRASLAIVGTLAVIALLGVPRGVSPEDVPTPRVAWRSVSRQHEEERALAQEALAGLPFEVRATGELVRRFGAAEASGDVARLAELREQLGEMTKISAARRGGRALLLLRALQTRLFLEELGRLELSGSPSGDLLELGGTFVDRARKAGWLQRNRLTASDAELAALFRIRWTKLVGLGDAAAFAPRLNDWRLYYRLRLRLPDVASKSRSDAIAAQLDDVRALSDLDASYPRHYANGILLYQLGSLEAALESFRSHLREHPDGEWTLRARNYATLCAEELLR